MVGGVCGGLGDYFGIDPVIFRIAFVVMVLGAGSGLLLYLVAWVAIPRNKPWDPTPNQVSEPGMSHTVLGGFVLVGLGMLLLLDGPLGWVMDSLGPLLLIGLGLAVLLKRGRR